MKFSGDKLVKRKLHMTDVMFNLKLLCCNPFSDSYTEVQESVSIICAKYCIQMCTYMQNSEKVSTLDSLYVF